MDGQKSSFPSKIAGKLEMLDISVWEFTSLPARGNDPLGGHSSAANMQGHRS